jgi:hypothetical protein
MSGPFTEDPRLLIRPLVAVLLAVQREHADDPATGVCALCRVSQCERAQRASGELLRAGYELDGRLRWADLVRSENRAEEPAP